MKSVCNVIADVAGVPFFCLGIIYQWMATQFRAGRYLYTYASDE